LHWFAAAFAEAAVVAAAVDFHNCHYHSSAGFD